MEAWMFLWKKESCQFFSEMNKVKYFAKWFLCLLRILWCWVLNMSVVAVEPLALAGVGYLYPGFCQWGWLQKTSVNGRDRVERQTAVWLFECRFHASSCKHRAPGSKDAVLGESCCLKAKEESWTWLKYSGWKKKKQTKNQPKYKKKTCCDLLAGQGERIYTPEKSCLCV